MENIISAMRALTQNLMRSVLTVTGIVIGVISIVTLIAILQGVKAEVRRQVEGLGANLVLVVPGKLDDSGQPNPMAMMGISSLTDKDISALGKVPGVIQISPVVFVSGTIENAAGKAADALVVATNRAGIEMNPTPLAQGRYFFETEENAHVCVLGDKPRHQLFGDQPVIGKSVRIHNINWTVVGALQKPKGDGTLGNAMLGLSDLVYLPQNLARREIPGGQINRIALRTDYSHPADKIVDLLTRAMRTNHGNHEDFGVITQQKGLALVIKLLNMAQSLLVLIAAISLFVAGVGIMNIMLVTVTERTREIGIRKTVGARRADIFLQFLVEAIILSIIGGAIGLLCSWVLCSLIARFSELTPQITTFVVVMALVVCTAVGVLFGVTPAVRAANLNPIDALRHE